MDVGLSLAPAVLILLNFALVDMFYGDETIGLQNLLAMAFAAATAFATYVYGWFYGYLVAKIATFVIIARCLLAARRQR